MELGRNVANPGNVLTIDVAAIHHNIKFLKNLQGDPDVKFMCVVKDNGYGLDMIEISKILCSLPEVDALMVAHCSEAIYLRREGGIKNKDILAIHTEPEDVATAISHGIDIVADCPAHVEVALAEAARLRNISMNAPETFKPAKIHIHVETGMGRNGCRPEDVLPLARMICSSSSPAAAAAAATAPGDVAAPPPPLAILEGLFTHMCDADVADSNFAETQEARFQAVQDELAAAQQKKQGGGIFPNVVHTQNSSWALRFQPNKNKNKNKSTTTSSSAGGDDEQRGNTLPPPPPQPRRMLRIGLAMYGLQPLDLPHRSELRPAISMRTRIAGILILKKGETVSYARTWAAPEDGTRVATISAGYGEGLRKHEGMHVYIRGKKAPVVGKVCMDFTCVDVTHIADAVPTDEVLLLGRGGDARDGYQSGPNAGCFICGDTITQTIGCASHEVIARGVLRMKRDVVHVPKL